MVCERCEHSLVICVLLACAYLRSFFNLNEDGCTFDSTVLVIAGKEVLIGLFVLGRGDLWVVCSCFELDRCIYRTYSNI